MNQISIHDNAFAGAILGKLKKGPMSQSELGKLFNRHGPQRLARTMTELAHAKQITRIKDMWHLGNQANSEKAKVGKRRIFCSIRYPKFSPGSRVKFQGGFLATDDLQLHQLIERSDQYKVNVFDVTEIIRPLAGRKATVYLSRHPAMELDHYQSGVIEFSPVADGLFLLVNEDLEVDRRIADQGSRLLKPGLIREVPRSLLEAAG